jgi:large subunit ribosomal protein L15
MKINELQAAKNKVGKRVGRGIAAGQGKTAGRGTKGQLARTGSGKRPGFAGGQTPLMIRLPKLPGFKSKATRAEVVYTGQLDALASKTIDAEALAAAKLITNPFVKVKVITKGEVTKKVTVKAFSISASAKAAIEAKGGTFEAVKQTARPASAEKAEKAEKKATKKKIAKK